MHHHSPADHHQYSEIAARGAHLYVLSLVAKDRVAGPHLKPGNMGEVANQRFGDAVAEIVGAGISPLVGKREHGNGLRAKVEILGFRTRRVTAGEGFVWGPAMADREIGYQPAGEQEGDDPGSQARRRPTSYVRGRMRNWLGWKYLGCKNLDWKNLDWKNLDWKNLGWSLACDRQGLNRDRSREVRLSIGNFLGNRILDVQF